MKRLDFYYEIGGHWRWAASYRRRNFTLISLIYMHRFLAMMNIRAQHQETLYFILEWICIILYHQKHAPSSFCREVMSAIFQASGHCQIILNAQWRLVTASNVCCWLASAKSSFANNRVANRPCHWWHYLVIFDIWIYCQTNNTAVLNIDESLHIFIWSYCSWPKLRLYQAYHKVVNLRCHCFSKQEYFYRVS